MEPMRATQKVHSCLSWNFAKDREEKVRQVMPTVAASWMESTEYTFFTKFCLAERVRGLSSST